MREHHLGRGNLLWEGSRMMLPEHREGLLDRRREQRKQDMPELDEDQQAIIDQSIGMSLHNKSEITLKIYDPFENCFLYNIMAVQQSKKSFRKVAL